MDIKNFSNLYTSDYFLSRCGNDFKRLRSFHDELNFINDYVDLDGVVCDIGCSTGEFLKEIGWRGPKFGMEINDEVIAIAQKSGIGFEKNILTELDFFDVVIFRGTIQHLPEPFYYLSKAYDSLKRGGVIILLATPNANSLVYKFFNNLPMLNPKLNFYIPSDITLQNVLINFNFKLIKIEYPYLKSPYRNLISDHYLFIKSIIFGHFYKFSFWKSMMNIMARK